MCLSHRHYKRERDDDTCSSDDAHQSKDRHTHLLEPVALAPQHVVAVRVPYSEYTYLKRHFSAPIDHHLYSAEPSRCAGSLQSAITRSPQMTSGKWHRAGRASAVGLSEPRVSSWNFVETSQRSPSRESSRIMREDHPQRSTRPRDCTRPRLQAFLANGHYCDKLMQRTVTLLHVLSRQRLSGFLPESPVFSTSRDAASAATSGDGANHRLDTRIHIGIRAVRHPTSSADSLRFGRRLSPYSTRHASPKGDWRLPHLRCLGGWNRQCLNREVPCSRWPPLLRIGRAHV